jgi:hypothetical protein
MEWTLEFDGGAADLTITVRGIATTVEFGALYRGLPDDPRFRPGMRILLDFWELDVAHLTDGEARAIGKVLAGEEHRYGDAALAVYAPTELSLTLTRVARNAGGFERIDVWVTDSYDEALAWLTAHRAAPPD